jgi:hypothetical protein
MLAGRVLFDHWQRHPEELKPARDRGPGNAWPADEGSASASAMAALTPFPPEFPAMPNPSQLVRVHNGGWPGRPDFRMWLQVPDAGIVPCRCGQLGEPHYIPPGCVAATNPPARASEKKW